MSCEHDCAMPPLFPADIFNRPALDSIGYRIGDYASFRAHMLARLDQAPALAAWTHRGADDPGIALLECTAIVGEIVAFYQQLYANEAWMRTADWRESVARLAALSGYRLTPGLGGRATFALAVDGEEPVTVPAGFGFKAELDGADGPGIFESTHEAVAWPALNQFRLYRKRLGMSNITAGSKRLELHAVGGKQDLASRQAVSFKAGDRIMLVPDSGMFESGGGAYTAQARSEVLVVKQVETALDRVILEFDGAVTINRGATVRGYKLGRTFRHFGHNAPTRIAALNETTGRAIFNATLFDRKASTSADMYTQLGEQELALDADIKDLPAGAELIVAGQAGFSGVAGDADFAVVKSLDTVRQDSMRWAGLTGGSTVARLKNPLFTNAALSVTTLDIRRLVLHEARSPALTLRAASQWADGDFDLDTELEYFGLHADAVSLAGRDVLLEDANGVTQRVRVDSSADEFDLTGRDSTNPWLWRLRLDQPPRFPRQAFGELDNHITVYGNLVDADEGETQAQVVLGSGDARALFQTFALPDAPLTWLLHNERTPPQVPELEVFVDGLRWQRVETFFGSGPKDRVYIVRQDDEGNSLVQFGDGKTGARLSSGRRNVTARFRIGAGARGPLEEGKDPKPVGKLSPLTELWMPAPATLGADPEDADSARLAAPARMQSLGRLVSLADYEAEAQALPGVLKARAQWVAPQGVPRLRLVVLTDAGTEAEAQAVAAAMASANRCRGASRFPIETVQGLRQYLHLNLTVGYAADRLAEDIAPAVRAVLAVRETSEEPQEGLFGYRRRQFGQSAHVSQVLGVVQQVPGVVWVRVDAFAALPLGTPQQTDPTKLVVPAVPVRHAAIGCPGERLLALHTLHCTVSLTQEAAAKECV
jgi:hypothetical protein